MAPRLANSAKSESLTVPSIQRTDVSQQSRLLITNHLDQTPDAAAPLASHCPPSVKAILSVFLVKVWKIWKSVKHAASLVMHAVLIVTSR